jgi:hypothetical protein
LLQKYETLEQSIYHNGTPEPEIYDKLLSHQFDQQKYFNNNKNPLSLVIRTYDNMLRTARVVKKYGLTTFTRYHIIKSIPNHILNNDSNKFKDIFKIYQYIKENKLASGATAVIWIVDAFNGMGTRRSREFIEEMLKQHEAAADR